MFRRIETLLPVLAGMLALGGCFASPASPPPIGLTAEIGAAPSAAPVTDNLQTPTSTAIPTATSIPITLETEFSETALTLPVTIRHVTEDSATIFFELSQSARGAAILSEGAGGQTIVSVTEFDDQQATQSMTLTGLTPGTRYGLAIGLLNAQGGYNPPAYRGQAWGPLSFATVSGQEPLRVAVIGDAGMGDAVTPQLVAQMMQADPDFVIFTGDTVYHIPENRDHYEAFALKYYEPFAPILQSRPIYNTVGNHDVESATLYQGMPFYYRAFPPFTDPRFEPSANQGRDQWAAFAYGDVQFLLLDTQTFYTEEGNEAQIVWLKERLADPRFLVTIPAFHIPPFTSGKHTFDGVPVRQSWLPMFEAARVPLVLSGHDHNYERLESKGITYIVSGGGSASLYQLQSALPESRVFAHESNFVILDFYADRIDLQAIALGGAILDQASIPTPR